MVQKRSSGELYRLPPNLWQISAIERTDTAFLGAGQSCSTALWKAAFLRLFLGIHERDAAFKDPAALIGRAEVAAAVSPPEDCFQ